MKNFKFGIEEMLHIETGSIFVFVVSLLMIFCDFINPISKLAILLIPLAPTGMACVAALFKEFALTEKFNAINILWVFIGCLFSCLIFGLAILCL